MALLQMEACIMCSGCHVRSDSYHTLATVTGKLPRFLQVQGSEHAAKTGEGRIEGDMSSSSAEGGVQSRSSSDTNDALVKETKVPGLHIVTRSSRRGKTVHGRQFC